MDRDRLPPLSSDAWITITLISHAKCINEMLIARDMRFLKDKVRAGCFNLALLHN